MICCPVLEILDTASFENKFMPIIRDYIFYLKCYVSDHLISKHDLQILFEFVNAICGGTCVNGLDIGVKTGKGSEV